jgi:tetratricopeptide (TPR) repeat protein
MTLNETEKVFAGMFDQALQLRDRGEFVEAIALLEQLVTHLTEPGRRAPTLLSHSHMQLGHIHRKLGNDLAREHHFRRAIEIAPHLELASLGLFHALEALGCSEEAMHEMIRYLTLRDSPGYRELLSEGFGEELTVREQELAAEARRLLQSHIEKRD